MRSPRPGTSDAGTPVSGRGWSPSPDRHEAHRPPGVKSRHAAGLERAADRDLTPGPTVRPRLARGRPGDRADVRSREERGGVGASGARAQHVATGARSAGPAARQRGVVVVGDDDVGGLAAAGGVEVDLLVDRAFEAWLDRAAIDLVV